VLPISDIMSTNEHACTRCLRTGAIVPFIGRYWHPECMTCSVPSCGRLSARSDTFVRGEHLMCRECLERVSDRCPTCDLPVIVEASLDANGQSCCKVSGRRYHDRCVACFICHARLSSCYVRENKLVCQTHRLREA